MLWPRIEVIHKFVDGEARTICATCKVSASTAGVQSEVEACLRGIVLHASQVDIVAI